MQWTEAFSKNFQLSRDNMRTGAVEESVWAIVKSDKPLSLVVAAQWTLMAVHLVWRPLVLHMMYTMPTTNLIQQYQHHTVNSSNHSIGNH